jgi:hypothetical protein
VITGGEEFVTGVEGRTSTDDRTGTTEQKAKEMD